MYFFDDFMKNTHYFFASKIDTFLLNIGTFLFADVTDSLYHLDMVNKLKNQADELLQIMREKEKVQNQRANELKAYDGVILNSRMNQSGKVYYYRRIPNLSKSVYIGGESNEEVMRIKEARYLKKSISTIRGNIKMLELLANNLHSEDYDSINESLPKLYRGAVTKLADRVNNTRDRWKEEAELFKSRYNVYRPEDLNIRVNDGAMVRSKSEAIIYNLLLDLGVTFVYEMPRRIGTRTVWPDFTLLSEIDSNVEILIEHQGLMKSETYRKHFNDKVYDYWNAGYVQGINIFFTFDNPDGGIDTSPIHNIVSTVIRK
jgi:hypothetical protein